MIANEKIENKKQQQKREKKKKQKRRVLHLFELSSSSFPCHQFSFLFYVILLFISSSNTIKATWKQSPALLQNKEIILQKPLFFFFYFYIYVLNQDRI